MRGQRHFRSTGGYNLWKTLTRRDGNGYHSRSRVGNRLNVLARRQGIAPEVLALNALQEHVRAAALLEPRDE